jgi:hypothetical protein
MSEGGTKGGLLLELYVPTNNDQNSLSSSSGAEIFVNPASVYGIYLKSILFCYGILY